jgi:hypothetical protein
MKAKIIPIIISLAFFSIFFYSCEDTTYKEYQGYSPVYLSYQDLRAGVKTEQATDLKNPGKIYFKDNYIFIVEEMKGIHVYDNTTPASPVQKAFISVPGVVDISISGYILYADSYVDLVVLDVENIDNIHEVGRVKDIFPYTVPSYKSDYPITYVDQGKGVVTKWELKTIKEKIVINTNPYPVYYDLISGGKFYSLNSQSGVSGSGVGVGGSMARFGIKDNTLYIIDNNIMKVLDISTRTAPVKVNEFYPGWNAETMFIDGNHMFLGTTTGMSVWDISNATSPSSVSFFTHARSCDPVIVDDTLAFVTLRTGTNCGGSQNVLDVLNIKDITKPTTVISCFLTNPHGLGKDGDLLFVCDGSAGLKVYDVSNPKLLASNMVYKYPNIDAFDVIPVGKVLVLIGDNGLYQYNYSDIKNITLLSTISVVK